ncbi:hypothetical protein [Halomarina pelagica]|uniref:hypothetical protein n=1 Tax=Halomarina pelagica TaxID=2961599 RepID=UPI0020C313FE|nr:hypothetical protein [Halomarina sp. BND7]
MPDTDGDNDDEGSSYGPIRTGTLKTELKAETAEMHDGEEMWVGDPAMQFMEKRLIEIARYVWMEAAVQTHRDDRRIVQPSEIDDAFSNLLEPHNLLMEAANEMERLRYDFIDLAEGSPAIEFNEEREELEEREDE